MLKLGSGSALAHYSNHDIALASGVRIKGFKPDTAAFVGYIIAHDSHHRGQIAMLARQAGFPLPKQVDFGMWEWGVR